MTQSRDDGIGIHKGPKNLGEKSRAGSSPAPGISQDQLNDIIERSRSLIKMILRCKQASCEYCLDEVILEIKKGTAK